MTNGLSFYSLAVLRNDQLADFVKQVTRLSFSQNTFHLLTTPLDVLKAQAEEEVMLDLLVLVTFSSSLLMRKLISL